MVFGVYGISEGATREIGSWTLEQGLGSESMKEGAQ
jgi:hypothetical protein